MENKGILLALIVIIVSSVGYILVKDQDYYSDELPHATQIKWFIEGKYELLHYLTVIPGYHFVIATISGMLGLLTIQGFRLISLILLSLFLIPLIYALTGCNLRRTLQFYFFPPFFYFFFLVYTDLFSLVFVLLAYSLLLNKKYEWSGIVAGLSLLIRQNNLFWIGFLMLYDYVNDFGFKISFNGFNKWIKRNITYIMSIMLFGVWVIINGGVVLGSDAKSHPISFHIGNIWFFLFSVTFFFLPLALSHFSKIVKMIKKNKSILLLAFGVFLIGLATLTNTHVYNQNSVFFKNKILIWSLISPINTILFFIPVVYGLLFLITLKFKQNAQYLIYLFGFITLAMSWMVEIRYYMPVFAFMILFREKGDSIIEWEQLIYGVLLSLVMFGGILAWKIFW